MKAKIVDALDLKNKGDIAPYFNSELGHLQLIVVCPGCGRESASAAKHKYDPKTVSYSPSIVHNKDLGGCGWHGWLRNGEFKEC
jgi:hypothetical protein